MIEILDKTGRIIGLFDEREIGMPAPRHNMPIYVSLIEPIPETRMDRINFDAASVDGAITRVGFRAFELTLNKSRGQYCAPEPLQSRWYLMPLGELPDKVWRSRGFIDLRNAWDK